ncbi:hypothetical protein AAG570_008188 [Ranatra chinensis]|uniref:Eukaryotic translation initiation factor 4E n=1 Tax=Ranatra chinensis TaxID=642074 RepID=A0ABD0XSF5_9HEMI
MFRRCGTRSLKLKVASECRNVFYHNKKQETTEITVVLVGMDRSVVYKALYRTWVLWVLEPPTPDMNLTWEERLRTVMTIGVMHELWKLQDDLVPITHSPMGTEYFFCVRDVSPKWEDPKNLNGGRWSTTIRYNVSPHKIWEIWMQLITMLVREEFNSDVAVVGYAKRATGVKLTIWLMSGRDIPQTGCLIRRTLGEHAGQLRYLEHANFVQHANRPSHIID